MNEPKRVEVTLVLEVNNETGSQDILTGLVDRIEETAKAVLPNWSALNDVRTIVTV